MAGIFPDVFVFTVNLVCSLIFLGCLTFVCVLLRVIKLYCRLIQLDIDFFVLCFLNFSQ